MDKRLLGFIVIFAFWAAMPLSAYAATPQETVEQGVNKVLKMLSDPQFKAKSKDTQISEVSEIAATIFDYEELSRRTLGREWKKMSAAQQDEFVELFTKLLQNVYADRLLAYSDQKVVFEKEIMLKKNIAEVQSFVLDPDGKKIPLFYRLTDKGGSWKVYDIIIEGVSMVKNYRTQFRQILANDSPDKLLEILRDKVKKS